MATIVDICAVVQRSKKSERWDITVHTNTWPTWRLRESLIVQKYCSSSIASICGIQRVARRIVDTQRAGYSVVVVLPEMAHAANASLALPAGFAPLRPSRELDLILSRGEQISVALLEIAISNLGSAPRFFTGEDAGLIMDGIHGKAHIVGVTPKPVLASLARKEIPIVTGFLGTNRGTDVVATMGSGGSDLAAVALAASLNAGVCEIYSDVDGLYTADPRIVPTARKVDTIPVAHMMELAAGGAEVLQLRCIEYARRLGVTIRVRSPFNPSAGMLVVSGLEDQLGVGHSATLEEAIVMGVMQDRSQVQVTVAGVPKGSGAAAQIFGVTAAAGVCTDMITHAPAEAEGCMDISFIFPAAQSAAVVAAFTDMQVVIGFRSLRCDVVGKISLLGFGLRADPDVLCRFLGVLSDVGITIRLFSDSAGSISAVTDLEMLDRGARAIREEFHLFDDLEKGYSEKYADHSVNHKR